MVRQPREIGSDAEALPESSIAKSSDATSVTTAATATSTEGKIATVAYQLWRERGCLLGSDQEDWFRAEAMLKNPLVVRGEDLFKRRPLIPHRDLPTESELQADLVLEGEQGCWVIWEREWVCARWVWDMLESGDGLSN